MSQVAFWRVANSSARWFRRVRRHESPVARTRSRGGLNTSLSPACRTSVDVTFQFSLRDHFGNPVSGLAGLIDVLLQDRIVAPPGVDVRWDGGAGPPEVLETGALGSYQTSIPYTFTSEGEFDLSIWVDFDQDATMESHEVFTLTIEAEEE